MIKIVNLTEMGKDQRKDVLERWFNLHVNCKGFEGHDWNKPFYDDKYQVWIYHCNKCDFIRVVQPTLNQIWINPARQIEEVLIATKEWTEQDIEKIAEHAINAWLQYLKELMPRL